MKLKMVEMKSKQKELEVAVTDIHKDVAVGEIANKYEIKGNGKMSLRN